ncbi:hypothetical protein E8E14_007315 [Neopestalotiopsis sp. 37M]|nr:hypothetical protein E8E14_007315 [Neopestalotiopsis sp. 37M]
MEIFRSSPPLKAEPDNDEYRKELLKNTSNRSSQSRLVSEEKMDELTSNIRVAVIGGGLNGAILLRGLLRYPHIAADLYEARPSYKEELPGMDLSPLSQVILHAIDPTLDDCLNRSGAIYTSSEVRIATGSLAGQRVHVNNQFTNGKRAVGRQALLSEVLSGIPPRMVHLNTRVTSISESSSPGHGLALSFADGSQKKYDLVIGADGVRGITRNYILGPDDPAQIPTPSGLWTLPIKVAADRARQVIEPEVLDPRNPRQITWVGDGTMMQHGLISNGRELVQSIYTISIAAICQMQYPPTATYSTRNACLIDSAAHGSSSSSSSSLANGPAVLALEEALVLSTLLGRATSRADVPAALRAYDEVCRPRAELVMRASADAALLLTGRGPGVGLDPARLAAALEAALGVVENLDIKAYCLVAIEIMDRLSHARHHW